MAIKVKLGDVISGPEKEDNERHLPVIEVPALVKSGEPFQVMVTVGKEVPHPNTLEHHIKWIQIFAAIEGRPFNPVHIATFVLEFPSGEPKGTFFITLKHEAILFALAYCNVHGLWDNSIEITIS